MVHGLAAGRFTHRPVQQHDVGKAQRLSQSARLKDNAPLRSVAEAKRAVPLVNGLNVSPALSFGKHTMHGAMVQVSYAHRINRVATVRASVPGVL